MKDEWEVVVVGGGPVGLVLAHALGALGVRTLVVEGRSRPPERSMAIGITPPSLEILQRLEIVDTFVTSGVRIRTAHVYENRRWLGQLDFSRVPSEFRFILSLPQSTTVALLEETLKKHPTVECRRGVECVGVRGDPARVTLRDAQGESEIRARWVAGCDGHRSTVREAAGIRARCHEYPVWFVMADFVDRTGWGDDARVFFGSTGAVESFPLPEARRRWIVQLHSTEPGELSTLIRERTGCDPGAEIIGVPTVFRPRRMEAERFYRGQIVLCGDAAHVMSPIGGQGMNTGFADAAFLAPILNAVLRGQSREGLARFDQTRRRAFRRSADRAACGMWIGTRRGRLGSLGRRELIGRVLFHRWFKPRLAAWFAMVPDFTLRAGGVEEMDRADCCPARLLLTVRQFASINRWFSRYRAILERWVFSDMQTNPGREYHLVDLGAGGGDIASWALDTARRQGLRLRVTAIEIDPRIVAYVRATCGEKAGLDVRCMDARDLGELGHVDYVFANHFLHHLDDNQAVELLRAIGRTVRRRAILSDLRRSALSHFAFRAVASCFYRKSFALEDGLLSIRKGFIEADLLGLARRAGLEGRVSRFFPGRIVLRLENGLGLKGANGQGASLPPEAYTDGPKNS